jgi:hypothetical protein
MLYKTRIRLALLLLGSAILLNLGLLIAGDYSAGWPIATVVLLGGAGASLVSERREHERR